MFTVSPRLKTFGAATLTCVTSIPWTSRAFERVSTVPRTLSAEFTAFPFRSTFAVYVVARIELETKAGLNVSVSALLAGRMLSA